MLAQELLVPLPDGQTFVLTWTEQELSHCLSVLDFMLRPRPQPCRLIWLTAPQTSWRVWHPLFHAARGNPLMELWADWAFYQFSDCA